MTNENKASTRRKRNLRYVSRFKGRGVTRVNLVIPERDRGLMQWIASRLRKRFANDKNSVDIV